MLDTILRLKQDFKKNHESNITSIESFTSELEVFVQNSSITLEEIPTTYWNNYFHAVFIAAFQELTEISLIRWNEYIAQSDRIGQIVGFGSANESQVLELYVIHNINRVFTFQSDLKVVAVRANSSSNPTFLTDDSNMADFLSEAENKRIIDNLKIVMKMRGLPTKQVWGDNDIIVLLELNGTKQQFCIISCKTSLRERVYQSIFWATHSRLEGIGKHVFVTTDKGASGNSEIGNRDANNNAKKSRDVLESTMDRVYVLRGESEVGRSQVIKDFSYLEKDLNNWAADIAGL